MVGLDVAEMVVGALKCCSFQKAVENGDFDMIKS